MDLMTMKRTTTIRFFAILLLAALSVSMTACTPHGERERLQRAEEVIETDAAAAAATLDSIRPSSLHGDARARYALLRTQSDYKNFVPLTSDSLIRIATRRYGTRRRTLPAALAQYYLGCCYKDMGRDLDAIDALLRATTLFPDTTNKYYAFSQLELGRLYVTHELPEEAIQVFEPFHQMASERADSGSIAYADYYMGKAYLYAHKETLADSLFLSVAANSHADPFQQADSYFQLAKNALFVRRDALLAERYINRYFALYGPAVDNGAAWAIRGSISQSKGDYDLSCQFFQKALRCKPELYTSSWAYRCLGEMASMTGHADSTSYFVIRHDELLDSVYSQSLQVEINEVLNAHTIELHDRDLAERHTKLIFLFAIVIMLLVAISIISILLVKKRHQAIALNFKRQLDELRCEQIAHTVQQDDLSIDEAEPAPLDATDLTASDESVGLPSTDFAPTVSPRLAYLSRSIELIRTHFNDSDWGHHLARCRADNLLGGKMAAAQSEELMKYITDLFSELFILLLADCPTLSRLDLEYCSMVMLRFKTDLMAYCTQATVHSYHCRHGKIRDKLTDDWYLLIFEKVKNG